MRSGDLAAVRSLRKGRSWRRWISCVVAASLAGGCLGIAWGAPPTSTKATTTRSAQEDAVTAIPFQKLTDATSAKLKGVVERPTIFRRLPSKSIDCDHDMYLFLVRYPEVVVNIWELMGVTNVKLKRTGEYTLECSDGAGTVGTVELVYGTHNMHILYAEATYDGPLTARKLSGRGVIVLRSEYGHDAHGTDVVENHLDVFIDIDQVGAELIAKTLQPLVGRSADVNFHESAAFVARVSEAAENNGPGMQRLAAKLKNVAPEVRTQFAQVATVVSERAVMRQAASMVEEASAEVPTGNSVQARPRR